MKKTIILESRTGRLSNREPFLLADNEDFKVEVQSDYNSNLLLSLKNGTETATLNGRGVFDIPANLITDGVLEIEACIYIDGALFKSWQVESIRIIKHKAEYLFNPVLEEFMERLKKLDELEQRLSVLQERYSAMEKELDYVSEIATDVLN